MKSTTFILTAFGLIVVIAAVTNPSAQTHKETVRSELMDHIQKKMSETNSPDDPEQTGQLFGTLVANTLVGRVVDSAITSDDYVLFSLTKAKWNGDEKNIGFGAFGNVWLSEKVNDALNHTDE